MYRYRNHNVVIRKRVINSTPIINSVPIDYNTCDFNLTPLYKAIINLDEDKAIELIKKGSRVNYKDNFTIKTPFGLALRYKSFKVINELLTKEDLYVNINDNILIKETFTELHEDQLIKFTDILYKQTQNITFEQFNLWFDNNNYKNAYLLVKKGFTIERQKDIFLKILNIYKLYAPMDNKAQNFFNYISKDQVKENNNYVLLYNTLFYLSKNIDITFKESFLYYALIHHNFDLALKLIKDGYQINYDKFQQNKDDYQVNTTTNIQRFKPIDLILKKENNQINETINNSITASTIITSNQTLKDRDYMFIMGDLILYENYLKKSKDKFYTYDPLIIACITNNTEIIKLLLEKNVYINRCYKNALYYAVLNDNIEAIKLLKNKGLDVNIGIDNIKKSYVKQTIDNLQNKKAMDFIKQGENINYNLTDFKKTLLYKAIFLNTKYYKEREKYINALKLDENVGSNSCFYYNRSLRGFYPLCRYLFNFYKNTELFLDFVYNNLNFTFNNNKPTKEYIKNNITFTQFIKALREYIIKNNAFKDPIYFL